MAGWLHPPLGSSLKSCGAGKRAGQHCMILQFKGIDSIWRLFLVADGSGA